MAEQVDCVETLRRDTHKASRVYLCDACACLAGSGLSLADFTFSERKAIAGAIRDCGRIKFGQPYLKSIGLHEGRFVAFRARPEIDDICRRYGLYED